LTNGRFVLYWTRSHELGAPATGDQPNEQSDTLAAQRCTALKAALLFLCVNPWEVRSLLSLKRAT
jgi:hypothetical protein